MDPFDFNKDGHKDIGEEWMEYQMMHDCMQDFDKLDHGRSTKPKPSEDSPSRAQVYAGCAVQLLGPILLIATASAAGAGAVVLLFLCLIVGGLIITNGKLPH